MNPAVWDKGRSWQIAYIFKITEHDISPVWVCNRCLQRDTSNDSIQCIFVVQALATFQQHGLDPKVNELGESLLYVVAMYCTFENFVSFHLTESLGNWQAQWVNLVKCSSNHWISHYFTVINNYNSSCLQCFDAVGWAAGMASGL